VSAAPAPQREAVPGLQALDRLPTTSTPTIPLAVRAADVFRAPVTTLKVPLNRKTTQNAVQSVRLDTLEPTRDLLPVAGLSAYVVKPRRDPPDVAHVVMRSGRERWVIQEGHTRLGAAVLRGDETLPARVWEFEQADTGDFVPVLRGLHRRGVQLTLRDAKPGLHPDWQLGDAGLTRQITFPNLRACATFISALMDAANDANHHPDVQNDNCDVTVTFITHATGTVTAKDYAGAEEADRLAGEALTVLSGDDLAVLVLDWQENLPNGRDNGSIDLGGPGSGNFGHAGRPGEVGGSADGGGGDGEKISTVPLHEPTPHEFIEARNKSSRMAFLSPLTPDDLKGQKLYLSKDGTVGGAMTPGGDMGNLFNNDGPSGAAREVLLQMIADGGKTADAYDGYLPLLYTQFGLHETGRMAFNPEYAPKDWNYEKDDHPDVIFLALDQHAQSVEDIRERLADEFLWQTPNEPGDNYYDDYDQGKRDATAIATKHAITRRADAAAQRAESGGKAFLSEAGTAQGSRLGRQAWRVGAARSASVGGDLTYRDKLAVLLGDVPGHEFHGNQWTDAYPAASRDYRIEPVKGDKRACCDPGGVKTKLTKPEQGAIGEAIVAEYLTQQEKDRVYASNVGQPNFPIDLVSINDDGSGEVIEVKAGSAGNTTGAQQWRLTIGEPGKAEKAMLADMSEADKARWNDSKEEQILVRKERATKQISKNIGRPVKGRTLTVILNPDTHRADVYEFDGFHQRIGWNSEEAKAGYRGTFTYRQKPAAQRKAEATIAARQWFVLSADKPDTWTFVPPPGLNVPPEVVAEVQRDIEREARRYEASLTQMFLKKSEKHLGDLPGHEFHGNQYSEGTAVVPTGKSVQLPGRYDRTKAVKGSILVTSKHGYIAATKSSSDPDYYWVNHIRVDGKARGKGEGTALYIAALKEAQKRGGKGILNGVLPGRDISDDAKRVWASLTRKGLTEPITAHVQSEGKDIAFESVVLVRSEPKATHASTAWHLGDLPGHDFHGNQWTHEGGRGTPHGAKKSTSADGSTVESWYDRKSRSWITQKKSGGTEVDSEYNGTKEGMNVSHATMVVSAEPASAETVTDIPAGEKGECFRNAARFVRQRDGYVLVHGKVTNGEGQTFDHAWAESATTVADPTTGVEMNKSRWYGLVKAKPEAKYTAEHSAINMLRTRNHGPWTDTEVGSRKLALSALYLDWDEGSHPRDESGRFAAGSVSESMAAFKEKYPEVASRYAKSSYTEMGSIEAHTRDVGRTWATQLTPEELSGISGRFGSDVGKLMAAAIPLHDIGKADARESGGSQHEHTIPILQRVLRREGFTERDVSLATELLNHDMIGPLLRAHEGMRSQRTPQEVATILGAKAQKVGMNATDFATLQLAFFHADASSYPFVARQMTQEPSGKHTFKHASVLAPIHALIAKPHHLSINLGDVEGHPFRGNQYTDVVGGGAGVTQAVRQFKGNEGYDWHERPEMETYVRSLPPHEVEAVNNYAGFSYADINAQLRGSFVPDTVNEFVRPATEAEIAAFRPTGKSEAKAYDPDDPINKVEDGRIIRNAFTVNPATGEKVFYSVQRAVPDRARARELDKHVAAINSLIREHGYVLPEPMEVTRAAYVPGLSYEDLKAQEGGITEERGFTSTMLGNPGNRLDSYVLGGKAESLYKRYADKEGSSAIYTRQDEVAAPMRISIILPAGTKVAPVETLRRVDYAYPKVQDPAVFDHPEWLTNDDGTPNGLKASDYTRPDFTAKPTIKMDRLHEANQRSEAEILLGSGAQFRIVSVQRGPRRITSSDPKMKAVEPIDVVLEYIGGGSSEGTQKKDLSIKVSRCDTLTSPLDLGDVEGHPFRGNQWTDGEESNASAFIQRDTLPADAEALATIEGAGPERRKWVERLVASRKADAALYDAEEAHKASIKLVEQRYGTWESLLTPPASDEELGRRAEALEARRRADPDFRATLDVMVAAYDAKVAAEKAWKAQESPMRVEVITNLSHAVAKDMGVDPSMIHVVDKEPSTFTVGTKEFREGGHYNPATKQIEINARNLAYGDAPAVKGIAAHETSHAIYHQFSDEVESERERYKVLAGHYEDKGTDWFYERFDQPHRFAAPTVKPGMEAQLAREFPASAVWANLHDGRMFTGLSDKIIKENGHSAYAKSYWTPEAIRVRGHGTYDTAINETVAEVTRWLIAPKSWNEEPAKASVADGKIRLQSTGLGPKSAWVAFTKGMHAWQQQKARS